MPGVVTLTTDFGTRDSYVAQLKGVLLARCDDLRIQDLTHEIAAHDVLEGALFLASAVPTFPPGTVHLAVVDPGVGSARRAVFAPAAAHLACGGALAEVGGQLSAIVELDLPSPERITDGVRGAIMHVDRFGNATTNIPASALGPLGGLRVQGGGLDLPLLRTYADAEPGEALALIGSSGYLEVAVRAGSAAQALGLQRGGVVRVVSTR